MRANEEVQVLLGKLTSSGDVVEQPLSVSEGARADIRLRSHAHDPTYIGEPGGLWVMYEPQGVQNCSAEV